MKIGIRESSMEIEFTGKRIDNGESIEGSLLRDGTASFIIIANTDPQLRACSYMSDSEKEWHIDEYSMCEVHSDSVGQFIGQVDKNKTKIFSNSKIRYMGIIYEIRYDEDECRYMYGNPDWSKKQYWWELAVDVTSECEVYVTA